MPGIAIDSYGRFVSSTSPSDPMHIPGFHGYGPPEMDPREMGPRRAPPPPGTYDRGYDRRYADPGEYGPGAYRGPIPANVHPQWRPPHYDQHDYDPRDYGRVPPPFDPRAYRNPDAAYFMRNAGRYMGAAVRGYAGPEAGGYDRYGYNPYIAQDYDFAPMRAMERGQDPFRGPMHAGRRYPQVAPGVPATASFAYPPPFPRSAAIDPVTGALLAGGSPRGGYGRPSGAPQEVGGYDNGYTESEIAPGVILRVARGVQAAWKNVGTPERPVLYVTTGAAPDVTLATLVTAQEQAGFLPLLVAPAVRLAENEDVRTGVRDAGRWIGDRFRDVRDRIEAQRAPQRQLPDYGAPVDYSAHANYAAETHPRDYDYATGAFARVEALLVDSDGYRSRV